MRSLAIILFLSLPLWAKPPFPGEFRPRPAKVIKQDPPEGIAFAWRTAHYHFYSDTDIPTQRMARFATTMESVPQLLEALPLPLMSPARDEPLAIYLCRDAARFESLGAPVSAGGYYDGRRHRILLRSDVFLTPQSLQPTRLAPRPNEDLLVHEVCHAHMSKFVAVGRPWITEGLAEYFAAAHVGAGRFRFADTITGIRDHVRRNQPLTPDGSVPLANLDYLTKLSNKTWIDDRKLADPQETYLPYVSSLLLVHYYLEGGVARRTEFTDHLKALKAYRDPRRPRPELTVATPKEVEEQLRKFWSAKGLRLTFVE